MQPTISVRGVTKSFEEGGRATTVLHGIDLDVMPGEMVLMMGPSGSGKTTLLSIMGCILRANAGSIRIAGIEVSQLSEGELPAMRLANIGFIFQGFNLFPTLTVGENVELSLDLKSIRGAEAKAQAKRLLAQVEMDHKYESFPADLSGGQKQRVAVARALAGSPPIILADEPTAALDSHSGQNVMHMLSGLAREHGRAVVVVSHDHRVRNFAHRIVRMEDGRIVEAPEREEKLPVIVSATPSAEFLHVLGALVPEMTIQF